MYHVLEKIITAIMIIMASLTFPLVQHVSFLLACKVLFDGRLQRAVVGGGADDDDDLVLMKKEKK